MDARVNKKLALIIVSAAVVLMVASGCWRLYYLRTPAYAFHQIEKAYQTHDVTLFGEYVDVQQFSQQAVNDVVSWMETSSFASSDESIWSNMAKAIVDQTKPKMLEEMEQDLLDSVQSPTSATASEEYSLDGTLADMSNVKGIVSGRLVSSTKAGHVTTVAISLHTKTNGDVLMDLLLQDTGRHMQLVKITNLVSLLYAARR